MDKPTAVAPYVVQPDLSAELPVCTHPQPDCLTESDMRDWLEQTGGALAVKFFNGVSPRLAYLKIGAKPISTGCHTESIANLQEADATTLKYCNEDNTVYAGQSALWSQYRKGDLLPTVSLLMMYQAAANRSPGKARSANQVAAADCQVGAFTRRLRSERGAATAAADKAALQALRGMVKRSAWEHFELGLTRGGGACPKA
jgi:hypothetical protein